MAEDKLEDIVGRATTKELFKDFYDQGSFYERHKYVGKAAKLASNAALAYGVLVMSTVLVPAYMLGKGLYTAAKWHHDHYNPTTPFPTFDSITR